MTMWLYIDSIGRVQGANPNDMTGNTGWEQAKVPEDFNIDMLYDGHGAALYKLVDGDIVVERTEEERQADWPEPEPMLVDPAKQLRADVDYIAMMMEVEL